MYLYFFKSQLIDNKYLNPNKATLVIAAKVHLFTTPQSSFAQKVWKENDMDSKIPPDILAYIELQVAENILFNDESLLLHNTPPPLN